MQVRFWGTRGSLPSATRADTVREKVKSALVTAIEHGVSSDTDIDQFIDSQLPFDVKGHFGGDTSCVEICGADDYIICDCGSGLRRFGNNVLATDGPVSGKTFHIFQSHGHWDHVMGFPFFTPSYIPGNKIIFYSGHPNIRRCFEVQQSNPHFPIRFEELGADIEFVHLEEGDVIDVSGFRVSIKLQDHPDGSYAFKFERDGKTIIYATDAEHSEDGVDDNTPAVEFFKKANLLIFDAMYSHAEARTTKDGWGHASNITAVEIAKEAGVDHLVLFHHDPGFTDTQLVRFHKETVDYQEIYDHGDTVKVTMSYDGLELDV